MPDWAWRWSNQQYPKRTTGIDGETFKLSYWGWTEYFSGDAAEDVGEFIGILKRYDNDFLVLDLANKEIEINISQVASAKTVFDW